MDSRDQWKLWYSSPASAWEEALPLGNGRLGAMVYGGADKDVIQLNEDTLWSGFPRDTVNYEARRYLRQVRELIREGRHADAERLVQAHMLGSNTESYQPLGTLILHAQGAAPNDYRRELNLNQAVAETRYVQGEQRVHREYWISEPDQVMAVRTQAEGSGTLHLTMCLESPHPHTVRQEGEREIVLSGRGPSHVADKHLGNHPEPVLYEQNLGTEFVIRLHVDAEDGRVAVEADGRITVQAARAVTLYLTAETNFRDYETRPKPGDLAPLRRTQDTIAAARRRGYESLRKRHTEDYRALFDRVRLTLGDRDAALSAMSTDQRLEAYAASPLDADLEALYFHFGRYLLISCSRPGTQPANLQGIWNPHVMPPWNSDYTTNINTEMNYWPAEACGLSECHEPLFRLVEELSATGGRIARIHYGCRGWTAHHNVDLWRAAGPSDGHPKWAFWPLAGAWLCRHLWEHYLYTGDLEFLRGRAYPLMKGAAQFGLDWLVEQEGLLVTSPSTSPENSFLTADGKPCSVTAGATMDAAILRELFRHCIEAATRLDLDPAMREQLASALAKLPAYRIGKHGQLQEWLDDYDEAEPGHRHFSHLYGLYPGSDINDSCPELLAAANTSIERRLAHGGAHTGWSCAWLINLYARLKDAERAHASIQTLLSRSTLPNLFDDHPPFQIDGNFGGTAGIIELLLQSHQDCIELLPALPEAWACGSVSGLRARGGYTIAMEWADRKLVRATVTAKQSGFCRIRYRHPLAATASSGEAVAVQDGGFAVEEGCTYALACID
ncbi:glycoside hydrolase family 95 protein [Xylanibacillus composti]|nr:glycoside hydrolase family 95 protein [Xylanibacillus composti]